jgi:hypothetical protein
MKAYEIVSGKENLEGARVSRLSAIACSIRSAADIDLYFARFGLRLSVSAIKNQLFFNDPFIKEKYNQVIKEFIHVPIEKRRSTPERTVLYNFLRSPEILDVVIRQSKKQASFFKKYLETEFGITRGDTVVFVDLGYTGTSQQFLKKVFNDEWGVELIGRYLIQSNFFNWSEDRRGLLDPTICDDKLITAICKSNSLLEVVCRDSQSGSTLSYRHDGSVVLAPTSSQAQDDIARQIQKEALEFVSSCTHYFNTGYKRGALSVDLLRDFAISEIVRFLCFPQESEIGRFANANLDLNLGDNQNYKLSRF